ncbi:hypothetical protein TNCV_2992751 [Trichonephila clavipes]|nr:hypothetical protein TNCV_2992751 [Trichonephila clavipes]
MSAIFEFVIAVICCKMVLNLRAAVHYCKRKLFREGWGHFEDAECSVRPQSSQTTENIEKGFCSGTSKQASNNDEEKTTTIFPQLPYSSDLDPATSEYFQNWHVAFRGYGSNLQMKLKVHLWLN